MVQFYDSSENRTGNKIKLADRAWCLIRNLLGLAVDMVAEIDEELEEKEDAVQFLIDRIFK